jgi:hypothetical protein
MHRAKQEVIGQIRNAFRGVVLGSGVGLFEGQALDDYADAATRKASRDKDEKVHWESIPIENLNRCYSSFSFFDAEGMRFHLPAFLIAELEGTLGVSTVFHLTQLDDWARGKLVSLSETQREAIREFLLFIVDEPDYEFDRPNIRRALGEYWRSSPSNDQS